MNPWVDWQNQTVDGCAELRVGRRSLELAWAAICPPLVAILAALLTDAWWKSVVPENPKATEAGRLIPLLLGGMAVLAAVIYLDCRARENFRSRVDKMRATLGISTAITLIVLAVAVTAQAERRDVPQAAEIAIFLHLPTLFACGALLWHAATIIRSSFRRGLMLAGFVMMTIVAELPCAQEVYRNGEERWLMWNSLLVALAFAIELSVWSARALGCRGETPT